ncbi:MAG: metallophosphoesterase [Bacteroidetes bacterium]|nr:metallophosphoesterase [Bacteroidota bacterium]
MNLCFFVSDLHGRTGRYLSLFAAIRKDKPDIVLLGGDLLPHGFGLKSGFSDFYNDFLVKQFRQLREELHDEYPQVLLILGNDDPRIHEENFIKESESGLWTYLHNRRIDTGNYVFYGYANVPPTPFRLKDWERYDVSRYVDPGCMAPTEGIHTVDPGIDLEYATIQDDLQKLAGSDDLSKSVFLFHSPPYKTCLDRAALDGQSIDHVPLDVHVGSIAIQRFIEERQPLATLHGHIHESSRITGCWKQKMGQTVVMTAAWDGQELALVRFDLADPGSAARELIGQE